MSGKANQKKQLSERARIIQRASWVGILGNGSLAVMKIAVGIIAGSAAVIADGIDSASDIFGSLITLFVAGVSENPPDKSHPWGRKRMETIATKVLAIFILFAGLQLVIGTAGSLLSGEIRALPGRAALFVTLFSIIAKAGIAAYKYRVAKKVQSAMVRADAVNMKNDIFLSLGVLAGLGITFLTNLPVIDTIVGTLLGIWIIINGAKLSLETNAELEDSIDHRDGMYEKLFAVASQTPGVHAPHRARIRKLNNLFDINLDIEVDGRLSVTQGHDIAKALEQNIKTEIPNIYDILVHVEPLGNEEDEQFGLRPEDFEQHEISI